MATTIRISCNGRERQAEAGCSVRQLLADLALDPETVVVELDRTILRKDEYGRVLVDGAVVEIIRFVGGG